MTDLIALERKASAEADGRPLDVLGMEVVVVAGAEATGGAYAVYRIEAPPGVGTPLHTQTREDEAFYVLEGTFEVTRDGEVVTAGPGGYVMIPRGVAHAFRNAGNAAGRLLGIASPAGHERFFQDVDALAAAVAPGMPEMPAILAVCRDHGVEILPG